jgi:hypothetical protein
VAVPIERKTTGGARRPEDTVRAAHVAHRLHAAISKKRARVPWRARTPVEGAGLAHLEDRIRHRVLFAMARATSDEAQAAVVSLASLATFAKLGARTQAALLDALALGPIDETLANDAARMIANQGLMDLDAAVRELLIGATLGRRSDPCDRSPFLDVAETPGFFELEPVEQIDLVRYLAGPKLGRSAPSRGAYLEAQWRSAREALSGLVRSAAYVSSDPFDQGGALRDFLYLPSASLYFLEAMYFGGRSIIVAGDPTDPRSLSYGQIPVIRVGYRRSARLESPDACVAAAWSGSGDASVMYSYRRFAISRDEARRFVEWAESAFLVNEVEIEAEQPLGPKLSLVKARKFFDAALEVANLYAARETSPPEEGFLLRGERCTLQLEALEKRACDELLARFLAL